MAIDAEQQPPEFTPSTDSNALQNFIQVLLAFEFYIVDEVMQIYREFFAFQLQNIFQVW